MVERTVHDIYSGKTKCPECGGGDLLYFEQPTLERVWLECQGCGCRFDPEEYGEVGG